MKKPLYVLAAVTAGLMVATGASAQKTYKMKIGMPVINDSNHFSALWMEKEIKSWKE